ncbi:MAG: hypothetical protein JNM56_13365 [Planctomycetia bacterium]|nr:hypothetical protein [Planctomycetia bacterium]
MPTHLDIHRRDFFRAGTLGLGGLAWPNLFCRAEAGTANPSGALTVEESGKSPDKKLIVTSPGVYKAVVWQASGGGINEFYDLASDPEAKRNLGTAWGLFEVGWHGAALPKDVKPDPVKGDSENGNYGCRFWPTPPHDCKKLQAEGELDVVEKSPARVRVRAQSWFTFWSRYVDKNMPVAAYYTFYPSGQIAIQVRVRKLDRRFQWSVEYGPHLHVPASAKDPAVDPGFIFSTPKVEAAKDGGFAPAEELVLATSAKLPTALMLTIPAEAHTLFDRHMRHNGRSVNWDRFGYGSNQVVMDAGYDHTWACLMQMGTQGHTLVPPLRNAKDALPHAMQYRVPARIDGAELVKDDAGDLNQDGYNESEGCHVLKGPGPLAFTYERGAGAGFAPALKVIGWQGAAPRTAKVDGKDVPVIAAVVEGKLLVQLFGTIPGAKVKVEIA